MYALRMSVVNKEATYLLIDRLFHDLIRFTVFGPPCRCHFEGEHVGTVFPLLKCLNTHERNVALERQMNILLSH